MFGIILCGIWRRAVAEIINENVEVVTCFKAGKIIPMRFVWHNREYMVTRVTGRWVSSEGESKNFHFSVLCGEGNVYEICFRSRDMNWVLRSIEN